ncbi:MAG TPA: NADH-quinone oxidoreductase subunit C [Planctomycetaceae bacterium]|nr:NADH-quinone oxidoreductase subunit C [Planctomycetaceae bacterium]HQZ65546.1 NADH-quinone oxidoreductase subunit C [Planctomycetaceae bacterium]HRA90432.1 NADH-quinone oxidoreductase subunit C [Planctomycetaceae bacterium]
MDIQAIHSVLLEKFGESVVGTATHPAIDPWIQVTGSHIVEVAKFLRDDERLQFKYLNDLCGVDYLEPDPKKVAKFGHEPHIEVVYQLTSLTLRHSVKLKVVVPRWENDIPGDLPIVPSVSSIWGIANWHEREAFDLMGIHFEGHPILRRILCPEDWVGHALRKDYEFPLEYHGVRGR